MARQWIFGGVIFGHLDLNVSYTAIRIFTYILGIALVIEVTA